MSSAWDNLSSMAREGRLSGNSHRMSFSGCSRGCLSEYEGVCDSGFEGFVVRLEPRIVVYRRLSVVSARHKAGVVGRQRKEYSIGYSSHDSLARVS